MKVTYTPENDILRILFCDAPIQETETHREGLILDYDQQGRIVGLELADASAHMSWPREAGLFEYATASGEEEMSDNGKADKTNGGT